MKINIQGNIIDTKCIYMIGEIIIKNHNYWNAFFTIYFINKKEFNVIIDIPIYSSLINKKNYACQFYANPDFDETKFEYFSMEELLNNKIYIDKLNSITKLRNDLIDIWNDNKSDILELKFE